MLSIFPKMLNYGIIAPTIIRLAILVAVLGTLYQKKKVFNSPQIHTVAPIIAEAILGICVLLGAYTQIASILLAILFIIKACKKDAVTLHIILAIISISLLFSGAGFLAVDLPL